MKVSTYKVEITPTGKYFPCYLSGHAIRTEKATGIMHQLWTSALLLEIDDSKMLWITVELIGLNRDYTDELRETISKKYDLSKDAIYINYVHTHSAPEYQEVSFFGGAGAIEGYMDFVRSCILEAVDNCFKQDQQDVKAYYDIVKVEDCYCNRNGKDKPCDKDVILVKFVHDDKVVAGICNFTNHSTVLGPQNLKVSNDLAGYVARSLEEKWGIYPLIIIGAAGDMSNRLYRQGNDENELERVGKKMMDQVFASDNFKELSLNAPKITPFNYHDTFYPDKALKQKQYDEILAKVNNAKNFDEKKVFTSALGMAKKGLECKPFVLDMECYYVDMHDLCFFVIPAELFSRFGIKIKQAMNCKCPILWGYCNYSVGYLGNREDYGASFETAASSIPIGTTEKIVDEIVEMIKSKQEEN